jgi:hypothetical protein
MHELSAAEIASTLSGAARIARHTAEHPLTGADRFNFTFRRAL